MGATAFDTLAAARRLKAAGIKAEHAEAIAEVVGLAVNQPKLVTVEHFDAEIANLHAANTRLHARLDAAKAGSAAKRDAVQSTSRSELHARTDTERTNLWTDYRDVGLAWLAALISIVVCASTLFYID